MSDNREDAGAKMSPAGIVGRVAAGVMVVGVLTIFGFILRTGMAHDETRCPFREGELREVAPGVAVREELRTCQDGVEERRWIILREGEEAREFARRRLKAELFADGAYSWQVQRDEQGNLVLDVQNEGTRPIEVLEAKLLEQ